LYPIHISSPTDVKAVKPFRLVRESLYVTYSSPPTVVKADKPSG